MYETFTNANGVSSWPLPRRLFDRISDLAFVEDEAHAGRPARQATVELSEGMWLLAAWIAFRIEQREQGIERPPTDAEFEALTTDQVDAYARTYIRDILPEQLLREDSKLHTGQHPLLIPGFFARFREPMKA
jgi:hypothetical protein